jgi:F-type H+-transporting ATPase subunit b
MNLEILGLPHTVAQAEETQTEQPAEEEHNPLIPEPDELIFGTLAFLLVFAVLAKYAFPRISGAMKDRTDKIQGDLEKAESERQEAEGLLRRYEEQLKDARSEANRIIEESRKTAEQMRRDLLARAEDESRQIVARAQEEIRAERDRAFEELRAQVGSLSVELASRVVGSELDSERQRRLVDDYIDEIAAMGNGDGGGA